MTECSKPEDLVKNRIFFGAIGAASRRPKVNRAPRSGRICFIVR
jgi:hypothetical protein